MVTPAAKREAVAHLRSAFDMSERRACTVIGCVRMTVRYHSRRPDDAGLRQRLRALAHERRRFGYRRLHILLRREGFLVNHKRLFRLYRDERLMVRHRGGRKRALGTRAPMLVPQWPNDRWSLDFVADQWRRPSSPPAGRPQEAPSEAPGRAPAGHRAQHHTDEDGALLFVHACRMGLEGIVSRRLGAPYHPARTCWMSRRRSGPRTPHERTELPEVQRADEAYAGRAEHTPTGNGRRDRVFACAECATIVSATARG
jgi:transposase InsO family protein